MKILASLNIESSARKELFINIFKNKIVKIVILLILVVILGLIFMQRIHSKSCALPESALKAMGKADAVFSGKVSKVKYLDDPKQTSPEPRIIVTLKVYRVWKGPINKEFVLHTVYNLWSGDGYFFHEDEEYLVFAYKKKVNNKDVYDVKLCGGTFPQSQAEKFLKELGPGKKPIK